ncbi:MAG: glycosyltransferase family 39 protein [Planctomycetota bacterium]
MLQRIPYLVGLLLVATASLYRLDMPVLWNDEADTAVTGRNVLIHGYPVAHDGRNVLVFGNCMGVSVDLQPRTLPPVQYYVAAAGIHLFGDNARGVRVPFALIGILAFFPLCALLRPLTPNVVVYATLLLLSPQVVLFHRNARYFPVLTLTCVLALWLLTRKDGSKSARFVSLSLISAVMFNAHPLAAALTFASFAVMAFLARRDRLGETLVSGAVGFASWFLIYFPKKPVGSVPPTIASSQASGIGDWLSNFVSGMIAGFADLDFVNGLPLVFAFLIISFSLAFVRSRFLVVARYPLTIFVVVNLLLQIVATAALSGSETQWHYAVLRYMPHLFVLLPLPLFLLVETWFGEPEDGRVRKVEFSERRRSPNQTPESSRPLPAVTQGRKAALLVVVPIFLLNVGGVSLFTQPAEGRRWHVSWWLPVYKEIFQPPTDPMLKLFQTLRDQAPASTDTPIQVVPKFLNDVFTYYVGDRYLIAPDVEASSDCQACVEAAIGKESFARFRQPPTWGVIFGKAANVPPGYREMKIDFNRWLPDATRPELTRHGFAGEGTATTFYSLFRKNDSP